MKPFLSPALLIACAAALVAAGPAPGSNQYTVTVDNGPHAGKYTGKAEDIQCIHSKGQKILFATFSTLRCSHRQLGRAEWDQGVRSGRTGRQVGRVVRRVRNVRQSDGQVLDHEDSHHAHHQRQGRRDRGCREDDRRRADSRLGELPKRAADVIGGYTRAVFVFRVARVATPRDAPLRGSWKSCRARVV